MDDDLGLDLLDHLPNSAWLAQVDPNHGEPIPLCQISLLSLVGGGPDVQARHLMALLYQVR
jgi:hypothetical protein